jgi:long-chain acyl-CoA synthetase
MLSHRNFTAFLAAFMANPARFYEDDVYLSFLPLPHVFERVILTANIMVGSEIVYLFSH